MDNSSSRTPLLLIGIFFLTVFIVAFLYFTAPELDEPTGPEPAATTSTPAVIPNQQQITPLSDEAAILTKSGSSINTRNFLKDKDVRLYDEGAKTYLLDESLGVDGPIFQIFYTSGGGITVSLLNPDLAFARNQAESALQKRLELPLLEMCALTIRVTTPMWNSEQMSGRDLGLSFCPGSVAL